MIDGIPVFALVELQANIYALNDALVKKGICTTEFLQKRKKFYEDQIATSLKLLKDLQDGSITRDEAEKKMRDISKYLVWEPDIQSGALQNLVEDLGESDV